MTGSGRKIRDCDRLLFPIDTIAAVVELFRNHFENEQPDLVLLSLVVGIIENSITMYHSVKSTPIVHHRNQNRSYRSGKNGSIENKSLPQDVIRLPVIELEFIEPLYQRFYDIFTDSFDEKIEKSATTTREQVKKVSDIVWNTLSRSYYKDRAHLQSIFSYLSGQKLDCFGVSFTVVAGCQVLGLDDVHLMLSEDHAWVCFGPKGTECAEVTWHGKGNEDKRGQPIVNSSGSWLYVSNCPVICTRQMEVAALISAINPALTSTIDAYEVAVLQQKLLWLAYDYQHLRKYPMALGNLGDLEEISPTEGRPHCKQLFNESINSAKQFYNNQFVYPYTFQGGYCYRKKMYKDALSSWADGSDVIRKYNYSREDEEIYKEFLEITNELIPNIMKTVSTDHDSRAILRDPYCFAYLLRFYDGICQWEEGSATPVLHVGWAKHLCNTISKFDSMIRAKVIVISGDKGRDHSHSNNKESRSGRINPECSNSNSASDRLHKTIVELSAGLSERILNPEFLLQGGGAPFVVTQDSKNVDNLSINKQNVVIVDEHKKFDQPTVILFSEKMKGLKDLLLAEKLNNQAISLQLTAQSQVQVAKKNRLPSDYLYANHGSSSRSKRFRSDQSI